MIIAPSILSADFAELGNEIEDVIRCGADWIHVDVMDGLFVPNISIGIPVVASIRKRCEVFQDVHLMITRPERYVGAFLKAGASLVCVHIESTGEEQLHGIFSEIHEAGMLAGLALKPGTDAAALLPFLDEVDLILIMTVEPGFGGQGFMADMMQKLRTVRSMIGQRNIHLEVDGGINAMTVKTVLENGADTIVAGSFVFNSDDRRARIDELRNC